MIASLEFRSSQSSHPAAKEQFMVNVYSNPHGS